MLSVLDHKNTSQPLRSCPTCSWLKKNVRCQYRVTRTHPNHSGHVLPVVGSKPAGCLSWITRTHPTHSGHVLPVVGSKHAGCLCWITRTHPTHSGHVLPVVGSKTVRCQCRITRTHPNHSGHVLPVAGSKPTGCQYRITITHPNHSSVVCILPAVGSKTVRCQYRVTATSSESTRQHRCMRIHTYSGLSTVASTRAKCTTQPRALQAHCNCSVQRTTGRTSLMASPSQRDVRRPLHLAARSASINQSSPAAKRHSH